MSKAGALDTCVHIRYMCTFPNAGSQILPIQGGDWNTYILGIRLIWAERPWHQEFPNETGQAFHYPVSKLQSRVQSFQSNL